ncbi:uncharacterized protein LOC130727360 [Lotus japonicus]|uniref:uncharacterized protein LOC130727360 n=1 Tax=Lotus japonicus TaxID=34305 RepID=UPI002585CC4A|nr:uncharacterized protein LOC130727360 [Lotus japonicus]
MDDPPSKHRILTLLTALLEASKDLHTKTTPFSTLNPDSIDTLLNLETKAITVFSTDPNLHPLTHTLSTLKTLIENLHSCQGYNPNSLLRRHITTYKISQTAITFEAEIQAYIDRVTVHDLVTTLQQPHGEDEQVNALVEFEQRLAQGFDLGFQDLVLRAKVFTVLERTLFEPLSSKRVKEEAAVAIAALVKFNKNVFVGLVLMGPTIKALIAMASTCSVQVLTSLVRFIRSPLVDEILSHGEIPTIVGFLRLQDLSLCAAALDCVMEIAYIGRMEVVEAMFQENLVKILMELQRKGSESGDSSYDVEENRGREKYEGVEEFDAVFAGCVSRFAIQLEVGEGLTSEEKTEVKLEVLKMVKKASQSDAECATVSAEILWGSTP